MLHDTLLDAVLLDDLEGNSGYYTVNLFTKIEVFLTNIEPFLRSSTVSKNIEENVAYLPLMEHVKLFRGILPPIDQDGLLPAGMIRHELRDVEDIAVNNHPAVVLLIVLGDLGFGRHRYRGV